MDRIRDSTKTNYYGIWKSFNEFYIKLDIKPNNWEDRLVLFAGYLADNKRKAGTIKSYISAIKAILLNIDIEISEDRFLLNATTRACRINNDVVKNKLPIHKGVLYLLLQAAEEILASQPYLLDLYKAMFTTAYYGLSELGRLRKVAIWC